MKDAFYRMHLGVSTVPYGLMPECPIWSHSAKVLNRIEVTGLHPSGIHFAMTASRRNYRVITALSHSLHTWFFPLLSVEEFLRLNMSPLCRWAVQ